MQKPIIVLTTFPSTTSLEPIIKEMITLKLAACVQLSEIKSFYEWQGKFCTEKEILLIIKTFDTVFSDLEIFIKNNHPYDVPEIISLATDKVSDAYKEWLSKTIFS